MSDPTTEKAAIPEFGMQTFENKVNPSDLAEESPSLMDMVFNISGNGPIILTGILTVIFLFSVLTQRPNWLILGAIVALGVVQWMF